MTRAERASRAIAICVLAVSFFLAALLVIFAVEGRDRVIIVDATTTGATMTFSGDQNRWSLSGATVCMPLARRLPDGDRGDGPCDRRAFSVKPLENSVLEWTDGSAVQLHGMPGGGLALIVVRDATLSPGTRILIGRNDWQLAGALTVVGTAEIGGEMANGESHFLLEGKYEMREKSWLSDATEIVKSGEVRRGERIRIVAWPIGAEGPKDVRAFVHITPGDGDAFDVSAIAEPARTALAVGFFGGSAPSLVVPTWIDRALSSPLFISVSAILTLFLGVGQTLLSAIALAMPAHWKVRSEPGGDPMLPDPQAVPGREAKKQAPASRPGGKAAARGPARTKGERSAAAGGREAGPSDPT